MKYTLITTNIGNLQYIENNITEGDLKMNKNEKISTLEFMEQYNEVSAKDLKEKKIKSIVYKDLYVSFGEKCDLAERIVNAASLDANKNINVNSRSRYLLYTLNIINVYTKIRIDFTDIINEYDILNKHGLISEIFKYIPQQEITEFETVLNMTLDDFMTNTYENHAFISNQIDRFSKLFNTTLSPVIEQLNEKIENMDEKDIEKLGKKITSFSKFIKK